MKPVYLLGAIPFIAILSGGLLADHFPTIVLGFPFLMLWNTVWLIGSSAIMGLIYFFDDTNREKSREMEEPK